MKSNSARSNPRVYVVVVTYNGSSWIGKCLDSLQASRYPVAVILVDNASSDETAALAKEYDNVTCLELKRNLGFGRANNIGIRKALDLGADYVFLLNQDAYVHADTLERLVCVAGAHPAYGIVSPVHFNDAGTALDPLFEKCLVQAGVVNAVTNPDKSATENELYAVPFVNAAAWLVTRECLELVGGFDPVFFMYGEDNDFCNRARFHGFEIGVMPGAYIHHIRGYDANGVPRKVTINRRVNRVLPRHIVTLKKPGTELSSELMVFHKQSLSKVINSARTINPSRMVVTTMIWFKVMVRLRQVAKHKRICSHAGAHWLSDSPGKV